MSKIEVGRDGGGVGELGVDNHYNVRQTFTHIHTHFRNRTIESLVVHVDSFTTARDAHSRIDMLN